MKTDALATVVVTTVKFAATKVVKSLLCHSQTWLVSSESLGHPCMPALCVCFLHYTALLLLQSGCQ